MTKELKPTKHHKRIFDLMQDSKTEDAFEAAINAEKKAYPAFAKALSQMKQRSAQRQVDEHTATGDNRTPDEIEMDAVGHLLRVDLQTFGCWLPHPDTNLAAAGWRRFKPPLLAQKWIGVVELDAREGDEACEGQGSFKTNGYTFNILGDVFDSDVPLFPTRGILVRSYLEGLVTTLIDFKHCAPNLEQLIKRYMPPNEYDDPDDYDHIWARREALFGAIASADHDPPVPIWMAEYMAEQRHGKKRTLQEMVQAAPLDWQTLSTMNNIR